MPKLRAPKKEPEIVPDDQPITIELTDEKTPASNGEDIELKEPEEELPEPEPEPEDDREALRAQVEKLTQAERIQRDRATTLEADRAEAIRRANEAAAREAAARDEAGQAQYETILNALEANKAEADAAQQALEQAHTDGNFKAVAEAQRRIGRAEAQIVRLEEGKSAYEQWAQEQKTIRQQQQPRKPVEQQQDPVDAGFSNLPEVARNWLKSHREYTTDPRKNARIQALHWDVVDEGHEPYSTAYFESLETHLGLRQPKEKTMDEPTEPATKRTSAPVSAPVTREAPSPSTGKPSSTRVPLSATERETARFSMPHLPPADAERVYAENKLKLAALKKSGHYQE